MKRVVRELAIMGLMGEDVSRLSKKASEVCYKNMKKKADPAYMNLDHKKDGKERVN